MYTHRGSAKVHVRRLGRKLRGVHAVANMNTEDVHHETVDGSARNDMHINLPLPIESMTRSETMHGPVLSKVVSLHC